jgi:hypothetical protein
MLAFVLQMLAFVTQKNSRGCQKISYMIKKTSFKMNYNAIIEIYISSYKILFKFLASKIWCVFIFKQKLFEYKS